MVSLGRLRVPLEVCEKKKCSNCLENACTKCLICTATILTTSNPFESGSRVWCASSGRCKTTVLVFNCWFESGSMPYAYIHYPFENVELFEKNFAGNFVAEGLDQTRGWLVPNLFRSLGTQ
ncbi:hypothetical protein Patl1_05522 [Pistacia atlantica]|uniref:Uncharacterized protein n=1 Tax=Pistacia atlantica TaxID=434234 RepID=A0ACC1BQX0_9ROSI|nr:hypothetical protein Patl1_05522 [Pistacia atlantica]